MEAGYAKGTTGIAVFNVDGGMKLDGIRRAHGGNLDNCPVRDVLANLSGKWSSLLLIVLAERPRRFSEIRRLVFDISQRMLTQTLRELQRDGYVHRLVVPSTPPKVEYSLTPLGHSMFQPLLALIEWADQNHMAVREARDRFDAIAE
jgi:DNA-binding HxlR family transcriptional regulator